MGVLREKLLGRIDREEITSWINTHPEGTRELADLALSNEEPVGWRATWILRKVVPADSDLISRRISGALERFSNFNESQQREWLKTLFDQPLTEDQEGQLFDLCLQSWSRIHAHSALRITAFEWLARIVEKYPELYLEISHVTTNEYVEPLKPGIRKIFLRRLSKLEVLVNDRNH